MDIAPELADQAIAEEIAPKLGVSNEVAADAVIAVAEANMVNAIRLATMRRGLDPRDFAMVAFGGAGPLHGARVAMELQIPTVVIPPSPGLPRHLAALMADIRHDLGATSFYNDAGAVDHELMDGQFAQFEEELRSTLSREGIPADRQRIERSIDMCYAGQWRVLEVPAAAEVTAGDSGEEC